MRRQPQSEESQRISERQLRVCLEQTILAQTIMPCPPTETIQTKAMHAATAAKQPISAVVNRVDSAGITRCKKQNIF